MISAELWSLLTSGINFLSAKTQVCRVYEQMHRYPSRIKNKLNGFSPSHRLSMELPKANIYALESVDEN